ncbi:uncharacterized protein TM35_000012330 [Trypanosoma theileri]|uniref:Uncharacterized protein n=1 Tax=Trypanosoma theileri TaxID=67003 RepID=A0A1X0P8V2_9TRYP|nr:uncharacterized protein TM35_000012330 [Trypanosoma theileri]ORC93356.1 hypothetical protein TM35_000012330 [Trypanosoma theileri]
MPPYQNTVYMHITIVGTTQNNSKGMLRRRGAILNGILVSLSFYRHGVWGSMWERREAGGGWTTEGPVYQNYQKSAYGALGAVKSKSVCHTFLSLQTDCSHSDSH